MGNHPLGILHVPAVFRVIPTQPTIFLPPPPEVTTEVNSTYTLYKLLSTSVDCTMSNGFKYFWSFSHSDDRCKVLYKWIGFTCNYHAHVLPCHWMAIEAT